MRLITGRNTHAWGHCMCKNWFAFTISHAPCHLQTFNFNTTELKTRPFDTSTNPDPCAVWKSMPFLCERIPGADTTGRRRAFVQLMRHVSGGQTLREYVTFSSAQLKQTEAVKPHERSVLLSEPEINHCSSWTPAPLHSYLCRDETLPL